MNHENIKFSITRHGKSIGNPLSTDGVYFAYPVLRTRRSLTTVKKMPVGVTGNPDQF